ncbi:MAG TPA: hypothetical protein VGH44_02195 [Candidatus Saccharimonadia bacterium]|jgi:hypothetical protein
MPPSQAPDNQSPKPRKNKSWDTLKTRANAGASIAALFIFLAGCGAAIGYYYAQSKKSPAQPQSTIQTLSSQDIERLNEIGANLGSAGQKLNVGADALFRGKADVTGDLTVGGRLNANGPVTLSQLNITGNTAASGLNVGSNLNVTGNTTFGGTLTVNKLTTVNSNLNVSGNASVGALSATSIAVRSITISGPLTISHLVSQGTVPSAAALSVGGGGTVSISGNDTTGQVDVNTGSGPGSALAQVTFRAAYSGTVHVQLTPLTADAATSGYYVIPNGGSGFQVHAVNPPPGKTLQFDYLVMQ